MDEIDPPVKLDDPSNEPSRQYLLSVDNNPDFDYPQVGWQKIKIFFDYSFPVVFNLLLIFEKK